MELTYVHYLTLAGFALPAVLSLIVENYNWFRVYYFLYVKKVTIQGDRAMIATLFSYSGGVPGEYLVPSWFQDTYCLLYIHGIGPVVRVLPVMFVLGVIGFFAGFGLDWFSR